MKKKISLYGVIAIISLIIRSHYLPDPFECFGVYAFWINLIAEGLIHTLVYALVGMIYSRGSCPPLGALLYLLVYCAVIGVLYLMSIFCFAWWWVLIILIVLGLLCYGIYWLKEKIFNG